ncbi:MAG: hypothetical protein IJN39_02690 [Clostridia bacterium]|nr:hypothetical protein [Clostridia bacterium]
MMKNYDEFAEKLFDELTIEDMAGQLMCIQMNGKKISDEEFEELVKKIKPGGLFFGDDTTRETIEKCTEIVNKYAKIPVIIACDVENGPGCVLKDETYLPRPMAWGACDDEKLIERAGKVTGEICRKNGIHWTFAPIVDINFNKDNPVVNIRAVSDSPEQVAKIAGAYVRGLQKDGMMMAACKHFPGDGLDDRNQHFCTTVNHFSKEEWMKTYGYVYKEMIKEDTASIMVAHIDLPWVGDEVDPVLGGKPATLSKKIMTDLLKGELSYEGCIVSDAMSMVGTSVMCPPDKLSVTFIKSGGDMLLFPAPKDYDYLLEALKNGEISKDRAKDAILRILKLKIKARLFEDQSALEEEIEISENIQEISQEIADRSITVIRNTQGLIPLNLEKGSKFLLVNLNKPGGPPFMKDISVLTEELEKRGYKADTLSDNDHYLLNSIKDKYDCILINCRMEPSNYLGGTMRINWDNIMPFWRGVAVDHPRVIFTSFGDPYKLYELPFLRTYVNAYGAAKESLKAFIKVLLGEKEAVGKSPVELKGFFKREV